MTFSGPDCKDHAFQKRDIGDDEDCDVVAFVELEGAEGFFKLLAAGFEAVEIALLHLGNADEHALLVEFLAVGIDDFIRGARWR